MGRNGLIFHPYLPYNTANNFGFGHCSPDFHGLVNLHPHQKNPGLRAKALLRETNKFFISPSQGLLSGEVGRLVRTTKARRKGQSVFFCGVVVFFWGGSETIESKMGVSLKMGFWKVPPCTGRPLPKLTTRNGLSIRSS